MERITLRVAVFLMVFLIVYAVVGIKIGIMSLEKVLITCIAGIALGITMFFVFINLKRKH